MSLEEAAVQKYPGGLIPSESKSNSRFPINRLTHLNMSFHMGGSHRSFDGKSGDAITSNQLARPLDPQPLNRGRSNEFLQISSDHLEVVSEIDTCVAEETRMRIESSQVVNFPAAFPTQLAFEAIRPWILDWIDPTQVINGNTALFQLLNKLPLQEI